MNLGKDFGSIQGTEFVSKKPVCRGYALKVMDVKDTISKTSGKPMLTIAYDIANGPHAGGFGKFPLIQYVVYGDEASDARLKGTLDKIIGQNPAIFPSDPFATGNFDEKSLIGCVVGGVLKWEQGTGANAEKNYLKLDYLTTVETAEATPIIPEPKPATNIARPQPSAPTGGGFSFS